MNIQRKSNHFPCHSAASTAGSTAEMTILTSMKSRKDHTPGIPIGEPQTYWPSIYLLSFINLLCGIQFSVYFPTLWPFLNTIDPTAPESSFGYIIAAFSLGQLISSPLFGYWMNRTKSVKPPLSFGAIIMILANLLFCSVESFQETNRRWVMLIARFFIGIGAGVIGVMRSYAATASTIQDRTRAITFIQSSFMAGLSLGPTLPVTFVPIGYPGFKINVFYIDMYTAPSVLASVVMIFSMTLVFFYLKENYAGVTETNSEQQKLPDYDKVAVAVCLFTQFALMFITTNIETSEAMYTKAMFGWSNEEAVRNIAKPITHRQSFNVSAGRERLFTILGLFFGILVHAITFSYPFLENHLPLAAIYVNSKNISEVIGCDRTEHRWCATTKQVNFWAFSLSFCFLLAIGSPLINISMNTLLSKILGPRHQGTVQGVVLMAGSLARVLGPLMVSRIFEKSGPVPLWCMEIFVLSVAVSLWLIFWNHLVPLGERKKKNKSYMRFLKNS